MTDAQRKKWEKETYIWRKTKEQMDRCEGKIEGVEKFLIRDAERKKVERN
jgi:hypothetical protein